MDNDIFVVSFLLSCNLYKFILCAASMFLSPLVSLQKDVDFECPEAKKQVRGSTSTKRSRAAEVHNQSERVCTYITLMTL